MATGHHYLVTVLIGCACPRCSAQEIGDLLMFAFKTPTGIPHGTINLKSLRSYNPSWSGGASGAAAQKGVNCAIADLNLQSCFEGGIGYTFLCNCCSYIRCVQAWRSLAASSWSSSSSATGRATRRTRAWWRATWRCCMTSTRTGCAPRILGSGVEVLKPGGHADADGRGTSTCGMSVHAPT